MRNRNNSAHATSESEADEEGRSPGPVAPDGGWGWVIVLAVFIGNCLMDGCIGSFGIFYPVLQAAFDSGPVETSMAGSLLVAVYQLSCPVVGILSQRFGCRQVCFVGGCIGAIGFILASIANNIAVFMVTFGFIVGIGTGMNYLPGHVITNIYFEKKRGIAGGIVCAGAGFGLFIMAPISQLLISQYGWRGAMLITAGIYLQLCVCAVLMRPLKAPEKSKRISDHNITQNSKDVDPLLLPTGIPNGDAICHVQNSQNGFITDESQTKISSVSNESQINGVSVNATRHCESTCSVRDMEKSGLVILLKGPVAKLKLDRMKSSSENELTLKHKQKKNAVDVSVTRSLQHIPHIPKDSISKSQVELIPANSQFLHPLVVTVTLSSQQIQTYDSNLSIEQIPSHKSKPSSCRFSSLDLSIFRNRNYVPLLLGAVFIQMGQFIPNTFLPEYCYTIGLDGKQVSIIMAIYGAVNIFGRLSAGCLANVRCVNALWLCNVGMLMCGVGCALFPLCTTFSALCAFAVGVGYFIGYFPPLQILIMVEYLGVEKLSSALGILMFAKGPAAFFGPPIAGVVYALTQNYALSIVFAAILFLLATGIQSLVPILNICSKKKRETSKNFEFEVDAENKHTT